MRTKFIFLLMVFIVESAYAIRPNEYVGKASRQVPAEIQAVELIGNECSICLEPLDNTEDNTEQMIATLACTHSFHGVCIKQWSYSYQEYARCPLCRGPMHSSIIIEESKPSWWSLVLKLFCGVCTEDRQPWQH